MTQQLSSEECEAGLFSVTYEHAIVAGSSYEAGRLQGEFLHQMGRALLSYEPPEPRRAAADLRAMYDTYCPGLTEEVAGLADSLSLPYDQALFCAAVAVNRPVQGCTHSITLPHETANGHMLVARNYDMALTEADERLCTTRIAGSASHIGFSDMAVGRVDGFNEHGLCVTLSAVWDEVPEDWQEPRGLHYAIALRTALEQCRSVDEAVDLWAHMPISSRGCFLVADRSGRATRVEFAGRQRAVQQLDAVTDRQHLVATNHFTVLDWPNRAAPSSHSTHRHGLLTDWLVENRPVITTEGLAAFLDRDWATGVSSYSPQHRAGTLWSMVFDVTAGTVAIRFGPPPQPAWHTFTLEGPVGVRAYVARFPC